jgi:hypothetical protein
MNAYKTLDKLATQEEALVLQVESATGAAEARIAQLEQAGVFEIYHRVHTAYAQLLLDPASGMEALKRALFLQWYGWLEPLHLTGLRDVGVDEQWHVMQRVDQVVGYRQIDREFACMLDWYYSLTSWFFDDGIGLPAVGSYMERSTSKLDVAGGFPALRNFLQTRQPALELEDVFTPSSLVHRGQMGTYFLSMLLRILRLG